MERRAARSPLGLPDDPSHSNPRDSIFTILWGQAVIPAEIDVPSQRRRVCPEDAELNEELLINQLDMIEERRERAAICVQNYHNPYADLLTRKRSGED